MGDPTQPKLQKIEQTARSKILILTHHYSGTPKASVSLLIHLGYPLNLFFYRALWKSFYYPFIAHFLSDIFGSFSVVYPGGSQIQVARIEFQLQTSQPPYAWGIAICMLYSGK